MPPFTIESVPLRATIDPDLGASLMDLAMLTPRGDWRPIMRRAPSDSGRAGDAAMFLMAPWTNRVANARFTFQGQRHELTPNFPDGTAIHGDAWTRPWRITDRTPVSATLLFDSREHDRVNFPWAFGVRARYEVTPDSLTVDLSVTNLDREPFPAGAGLHPFFNRRLWADDDEVRVRAPVGGRYPCEGQLPTGPATGDEASQTLRELAPLGNPGLDDVFNAFSGEAVIEWPASAVRLTMTCSESLDHLVLFTPRDPKGGALSWFCLEPTSMVNDGFNLMERGQGGTGVRVLEPGATLDTQTTMRMQTLPGGPA
jgi:aldose 1-epimerase